MPASARKILQFADASFDPIRRTLQRPEAGVDLDRSAAAILHCLAERAGKTIGKDELIRIGWPGRVVTENSLSKAIARLRAALDDAEGRLIESDHGFGYRLSAGVRVIETAPAAATPATTAADSSPTATQPVTEPVPPAARPSPAASMRPLIRAASLLLLVTALAALGIVSKPGSNAPTATSDSRAPVAIAILPFRGSGDAVLPALHRELATALAQAPQLRLVAPESLERFRDQPAAVDEVTRSFAVDAILSGEVQAQADRWRIRVELIRTRDSILVWSQVFQGARTDITALTGEIAAALPTVVAFAWSKAGIVGEGRRTTRNEAAYAEFFKAQALFKDDETGGRRALAAYERAVAIDPNYSEAWLALADLLSHNGFYAGSAAEALAGKRRAMEILDRLLGDDPQHLGALRMRGALRAAHWWDWDGAEADFRLVASLEHAENAHDHVNLARIAGARGQLDAALALAKRAIDAAPMATSGHDYAAYLELARGNLDQAERFATLATRLAPLDEHAHYYLGLIALLRGDRDAALAHFDDSAHVLRLAGRAAALSSAGDRVGSERELEQLRTRYGHLDAFRVAQVHAWRNEPDAAFDWLARAIAQREASLMYLQFDPLLAPLRTDPRFAAVLAEVKLVPRDAGATR